MKHHQTYYLSPEASILREEALVDRIVKEHCGTGPYTFEPESDFNRLPKRLQKAVIEKLHEDNDFI
jgi:hypothetical protein